MDVFNVVYTLRLHRPLMIQTLVRASGLRGWAGVGSLRDIVMGGNGERSSTAMWRSPGQEAQRCHILLGLVFSFLEKRRKNWALPDWT